MLKQFFQVAVLSAITQLSGGLAIRSAPDEVEATQEHALTQIEAQIPKVPFQ